MNVLIRKVELKEEKKKREALIRQYSPESLRGSREYSELRGQEVQGGVDRTYQTAKDLYSQERARGQQYQERWAPEISQKVPEGAAGWTDKAKEMAKNVKDASVNVAHVAADKLDKAATEAQDKARQWERHVFEPGPREVGKEERRQDFQEPGRH